MPVANALIGLGSNLGDRLATLEAALERLRRAADIEIFRQSPWLETEPAGGPPNQMPFMNGAAWLKTTLAPPVLLARLQEIELALGRERQTVWGPRTLDLDLLLYDDVILNLPDLQIPHRWLPFRRFVLDPAVVIAPDWIHPILQKSINDLRVQLRAIPYWFVIGGGNVATRESLSWQLAKRFQGYRVSRPGRGDENLEKLPLRELPPRGIFLSSVDWTINDSECEAGLVLRIPAPDSSTTTAWELDPGGKAWPLPKARIQLCANQEEYLTTEFKARLAPLYQSLSPLPTLNLLVSNPDRYFDQAATLITALTPNNEQD